MRIDPHMKKEFNFGNEAARRVEAVYQVPDVVAQRAETLRILALKPGERVLDIGSGPGLLAGEMGAAVGASGEVHGMDPSEAMLALSQRRCAEMSWIRFRKADAAALPFDDEYFNVAVSTQVYEYVADMNAALSELHRVLRPGGRALILDTDWDSIVWQSSDRPRMERVLNAWEEHLFDPRLPRSLAPRLRNAGFTVRLQGVIPLLNPVFDPNTYSHSLLELIESFVPERQGLTRADAKAWADDLRKLGKNGEYFFSLNRYYFLADKPKSALVAAPSDG